METSPADNSHLKIEESNKRNAAVLNISFKIGVGRGSKGLKRWKSKISLYCDVHLSEVMTNHFDHFFENRGNRGKQFYLTTHRARFFYTLCEAILNNAMLTADFVAQRCANCIVRKNVELHLHWREKKM